MIHLRRDEQTEHGPFRLLCEERTYDYFWGSEADSCVQKDLGLGGGIYKTDVEGVLFTHANAVATCPECVRIRAAAIHASLREKYRNLYLGRHEPKDNS